MSLNTSTDAPLTVAVAAPRSSDSAASLATAALITRIAEGDPRAINEFYRLYRRRILAVALRVVGNEWDAEEVLQDVVWVVFRKVEGFRGESEFSSWLYRVTHNCAKMLLRKRKRVPVLMESEDLEPALAHERAGLPDLHDALAQRQTVQQLQRQVDQMDAINKAVFWSAAVEGEAAQEVSDRMGLSVLAVKARLFRIRTALRQAAGELTGLQGSGMTIPQAA